MVPRVMLPLAVRAALAVKVTVLEKVDAAPTERLCEVLVPRTELPVATKRAATVTGALALIAALAVMGAVEAKVVAE